MLLSDNVKGSAQVLGRSFQCFSDGGHDIGGRHGQVMFPENDGPGRAVADTDKEEFVPRRLK